MEKTLFLLLFPFALFSQTDTTSAPVDTIPAPAPYAPTGLASDTIYPVYQNGGFYIVSRRTQNNGAYLENAVYVGDTAALIDRTEGLIVQNSDLLYKAATAVLASAKYWNQAINEGAALQMLYGQNPLLDIQKAYDAPLISGNWILQTPEGSAPVVFARDASEQLTVTISGEAKRAYIVAQCLRVENFTPGQNLNFYNLGGVWVDVENRFKFIPIN